MKNFRNIFGIATAVCILLASTKISRESKPEVDVLNLKSLEVKKIDPQIIIPEIKINLKNHSAFLDAIGNFESSNRYNIVNRFGYMGKYQFGSSTLKSIGIDVSRKTFLNSPTLQEEAMQRLLSHNKKTLKKYIKKYNGKYIHGVYITESGVLAAAHLAGAGNVRKFFRRGYEFKDGNGTKLTTYMKLFSDYQLDI